MLRPRLCGYSDAYILVKRTVTVATLQLQMKIIQIMQIIQKKLIFKNLMPFIKCIRRINNTQTDDLHDNYVVMPIYSLIEYIDNYSKISGNLWQYFSNEPPVNAAEGNIVDFTEANANSNLFKIKEKVTGKTGNNGTKDVEIMVPLKYLSNFWKTIEIPLINCEINVDLN